MLQGCIRDAAVVLQGCIRGAATNHESALDMVASYGRALAWSTELVSMLDVRARKICSEIGSHFNSRSESTKVVAKLKSNKPTKVKTKFEAIKFL